MTVATENRPAVLISEKAAGQIRKLATTENKVGHGIRVSVKGGGCSGLTYKLDLENTERE
ncbi:MAG: iron-sulfur cluster assembly accessory protein, partial [Chloroflexi bacterium]|nr:iron-sulfur cluster assembly accessory protein [Chloroflexota bacterium]